MASIRHCATCGAALIDSAPDGQCPECLIQLGLKAGVASADDPPDGGFGLLPREFGDYELLEEIARGGMGVVYRARQKSLDRIVAVKLILSGHFAGKDSIHRFRTEASAAAALQHPNIVAIHEVGVHQGEHYLAMDLVDGPNLAQFVKGTPLPAQRAARYLQTVAEAIHYAHERGILHRDLKPSNILIDANEQPRVTDFGLAKRIVAADVRRLTSRDDEAKGGKGEKEKGGVPASPSPGGEGRGEGGRSANFATEFNQSLLTSAATEITLTGQVLGSPNYIPPEQASGKRGAVSARSDIYSLGAILYHLLTGRGPFVSDTVADTLHQVLHEEPVSPRLLNRSVPRDLETICLKCLQKEPGCRYSTARDLADELGRFLNDDFIQARPVSRVEKAWRWCRRKPAIAGMSAGTVLIASIGLAGWLVANEKSAEAAQAMVAKTKADEDAANKTLRTAEILRASDEFLLQQAFKDTNNLRGPALLKALEEAIGRQPTGLALWQAKTEVLIRANRFDDAMNALDRAIWQLPENPVLWTSKGELAERTRHTGEAFQAYTKAIEIAARDTNAFLKVLFSALLQRSRLLNEMGRFDEAGIDNCRARRIPLRNPKTPPELLDLSRFYNGSLGNFLPSRDSESTEMLSRVAQQNTRVAFDARGYVGLYGKRAEREGVGHILQSVLGIPIKRRLARLHIMHATYNPERDGTQIGYYVLHFADGQSATLPIIYGEDVRDRLHSGNHTPTTRAKVAWTGKNGKSAHPPREVKNTLYEVTWPNPHPEVEIKSLDFISAMTESGPVLIAITVE